MNKQLAKDLTDHWNKVQLRYSWKEYHLKATMVQTVKGDWKVEIYEEGFK